MPSKILECVLCAEKYSEEDVRALEYFPSTRICYACYSKMQDSGYDVSCFGKPTVTNHPGYDGLARECRTICPDRKLCPAFLSGALQKEKQELIKLEQEKIRKIDSHNKSNRFPFRPRSVVYDGFLLLLQGTSKKDFERWCRKKKTGAARLYRSFRKEERNGFKWRLVEQLDYLRIEYATPEESSVTDARPGRSTG